MEVTPYSIAERFIGMKEIPGKKDNPLILAMLQLDQTWPQSDEVPWCSAFVNFPFWLLRLPRSKSLRARSWLTVGQVVPDFNNARRGYDVVILDRGKGPQPGPEVLDAPGHVGFYSSDSSTHVALLGGNQNDTVGVGMYPMERVLGIRRVTGRCYGE